MIVWASGLTDDQDFCNAIIADTELTHCNQLVFDAMNVYSLSFRYLLNNPSDINRALKAFEIAIHTSTSEAAQFEDPTTKESCFKWLKLAKKLYDKSDHNELDKFQSFP